MHNHALIKGAGEVGLRVREWERGMRVFGEVER
jgi:hypothetical protein